jgi:hypothetical protein
MTLVQSAVAADKHEGESQSSDDRGSPSCGIDLCEAEITVQS